MKRIDLINRALVMSQKKYKVNPDYFILEAIIAQLEYLSALVNGGTNDRSKLNTIIIGRMTAYDIHNWDHDLAEILYLVAAEVRKMKAENGGENA